METQVAKSESKAVGAVLYNREQVLSSDVKIPRILLMQGLSDFVKQRKAQHGDIVRSTSIEKLGDFEVSLEFIPLTFRNRWNLFEKVGGKLEYRGTEERNAKNETLPWEYTHNGLPWKRVKVIDVFALLTKDIDAEQTGIEEFKKTGKLPDLNKTLLPVVISFRVTSYRAGQDVVTHFTKAQGMSKAIGAPVKAHAYTLWLGCQPDKNDKGHEYNVFTVKSGGAAKPAHVEVADNWYQIIASKPDIKVDETEELGDTDSESF